jgi:DNA-binding beta-propeller fold protein YncE
MEERPPSLPDVWGEREKPDVLIVPPAQKTVPIKTFDLGPLGEFPQKTVILVAGVVALLVVMLVAMWISRPEKPVVLGALDRAIAISPDGERLLVGMRDGSVHVVDLGSKKTLAKTELGAPILAVTFGPRESVIVLVDAGAPDPVNERATESQPTMQILPADLSSRVRRQLQPNAHDVVWSDALQSAIVLSGGNNDLHASLEIFPDRPMGIATSTPELIELPTYTTPRHLAVSEDGSRVAVTLATSHRVNLLIFDVPARHIVSSLLTPGKPAGVAINSGATAVVVCSPETGAITRVTGSNILTLNVGPSSSAAPPTTVVMGPDASKAYSGGGLDVPEADFENGKITRQAGLLPTEHHASSSLTLSPDGKTMYVTFEDRNGVGVVDVPSMQWLREIELH